MIEVPAEKAERYEVIQFYLGEFLVSDTRYGEVLAICPVFIEYDWGDKCLAKDAQDRAQAICSSLNKSGYDWRPLGDHTDWIDQ